MIAPKHFLPLLALCVAEGAFAQDPETFLREGNKLYRKGEHAAAADRYTQAGDDPRALFNKGNALYRQEQAEEARAGYEAAAARANDPREQARADRKSGV